MAHRHTMLCAALSLGCMATGAQTKDNATIAADVPVPSSMTVEAVQAPVPADGVPAADAQVAEPDEVAAPALPAPKVSFARGTYREGIENLRLVTRESTGRTVAMQVGLNIALIALTGGVAVQGFSKGDLAGDALEGLDDERLRDNPARTELPSAVTSRLERLYRERAAAGEPVEDPMPLQVRPAAGGWHLVYENLSADDGLFRLQWGAEVVPATLRMFRMPKRPIACSHQSEPLTLADWRAEGWQRLRVERNKAIESCTRVLDEQLQSML